MAPQTYAEYAIAQPPGGAGPTVPRGSEPSTGENPSQTQKTGAKSSSIIVSPRQVRRGDVVLGVPMGLVLGVVGGGLKFTCSVYSSLPHAFITSFIYSFL